MPQDSSRITRTNVVSGPSVVGGTLRLTTTLDISGNVYMADGFVVTFSISRPDDQEFVSAVVYCHGFMTDLKQAKPDVTVSNIPVSCHYPVYMYIDGLVQERRNSIANALELLLSCINPSKYRSPDRICLRFCCIDETVPNHKETQRNAYRAGISHNVTIIISDSFFMFNQMPLRQPDFFDKISSSLQVTLPRECSQTKMTVLIKGKGIKWLKFKMGPNTHSTFYKPIIWCLGPLYLT